VRRQRARPAISAASMSLKYRCCGITILYSTDGVRDVFANGRYARWLSLLPIGDIIITIIVVSRTRTMFLYFIANTI